MLFLCFFPHCYFFLSYSLSRRILFLIGTHSNKPGRHAEVVLKLTPNADELWRRKASSSTLKAPTTHLLLLLVHFSIVTVTGLFFFYHPHHLSTSLFHPPHQRTLNDALQLHNALKQ